MRQSRVVLLLMLVAQRAGGAIVVIVIIVALAVLVALGGSRVLNDNSSQFYSSILVKSFSIYGLEECAMHIDNPQMRGLFFCGVTRQMPRVRPTVVIRRTTAEMHPMMARHRGPRRLNRRRECAGYSRMRKALILPLRLPDGVMDIERRAIPYLSYAYPIVRFQSGSNQVPMRFQWR